MVMMMRALCLAVVGFCLLGSAWSSSHDDFQEAERLTMKEIMHQYETNPAYAKLYDEWVREQNQPLLNETFPCESIPPSTKVPTSVHKLTPGDIKVVSAVGDSLTAGRAILHGAIGLLFDFPELSWSIGGKGTYKDHVTLPNILRQYNPKIVGASPNRKSWAFNKAVSGAKSDKMAEEIEHLVQAMKDDKDIDIENDWKILTFFIGGNDLCAICKNYTLYAADNYLANVRAGLDYLHANMPRTFVNLVEVINIEMVQELGNNLLCEAAHRYACACGAYPKDEAARILLVKYREEYQEKLRELADSGRYDTKDDFTVVLQPFYRNTYPPYKDDGSVDLSYFASDCFHQSVKGQQAAAKALWNNMVEPVGSKRLDWHPHEALECPTKSRPYLFTKKNSRQ